ncbi:hypothetical protein L917_12732 [Phytophthora nicotianae]|uniref:START domain-containing protein n=1 Tax=Phytophthora nicotianae TaxID=4792 RepID=W2GF41_PHYNI|nr:hypothetical protein L915_12992 [Phytophthora nicotianae]ETL88186.1 hypothetical protein L917_12732 [Phytophthora nicotianae]
MTSAHANGTAVPRPMSPSSADQRVLASFLLEMNVSDFAPDAQNREKRASTKRKAETLAHPCTKKAKWPWECRNEQLQSLRSESEVRTDFDQIQVHRGGEVPGATALELKRIHLLPFTTNVASKSVWDVMKLGVISSERCARVSIRSEDLLTSQGCFTHELDDVGRVDVRICCLMKRIEGPEGCTVLIESITEWVVRLSNSREWKHMTRDSGWVAVRPVASTAQLCQLKLEMRLQTNESVKVSTTQSKRDSLLLARGVSDVMVASVRNVLNSRHQLIDNALLDTRTTQHVAG